MGSGGDSSNQLRPISKNTTEGGKPILIPRNTGEDVAQAVKTDGFLGDDGEPPRHSTSAVRFDIPPGLRNRTTGSHQPASAIPSRRQQVPTKNVPMRPAPRPAPPAQKRSPEEHSHFNVHWLLPVGITMVILVILWMVGSAALAWGHQRLDDLQYGNPRTYQTDMVVGHNDSPKSPSHFIALNLHSQIIVVEFMGGNPQKAVTYVTPVFIAGSNGDLAPVTLEFRDVNGDSKLDMLVHIHLSGQDQVSVFINDGNKFRPSNGSDKIAI